MSSDAPAPFRAPKRARGRLRVAAIMDAAVTLFTERGYDAATMTEIASRSGTAIGSLYRFFPTKEVIGGAILSRYAERLETRLGALAAQAPYLAPAALADALVDVMLDLLPDRAAAVALLDARGGAGEERGLIRAAMLRRIAAILEAAFPGLAPATLAPMSAALLHVFKAVGAASAEVPDDVLAEIRLLVRSYLEARALASAGGAGNVPPC